MKTKRGKKKSLPELLRLLTYRHKQSCSCSQQHWFAFITCVSDHKEFIRWFYKFLIQTIVCMVTIKARLCTSSALLCKEKLFTQGHQCQNAKTPISSFLTWYVIRTFSIFLACYNMDINWDTSSNINYKKSFDWWFKLQQKSHWNDSCI